jgi:hypothetical protein
MRTALRRERPDRETGAATDAHGSPSFNHCWMIWDRQHRSPPTLGYARFDPLHDANDGRVRGDHEHVRHGDDPFPRRLAAAVPGAAVHLDPGHRLAPAQGDIRLLQFSMVKAFVPRYRYDQLMRLGWKVFLPISLAMIVIVAAVLEIVRG